MKHKLSRPLRLRPRLRVLAGDDIAFGPGKAELLSLVKKTGSIREAAQRMGLSYMRAWLMIQTINRSFKEPLVRTARGGQRGGGAELTGMGVKALELYRQMEQVSLRATSTPWRQLRRLLRD